LRLGFDFGGSARLAQEAEGASGRLKLKANADLKWRLGGFWHADCLVAGMADENYLLFLVQLVCVLMFSCAVVVLTQHSEWFGA
jgi:hypothetical protein